MAKIKNRKRARRYEDAARLQAVIQERKEDRILDRRGFFTDLLYDDLMAENAKTVKAVAAAVGAKVKSKDTKPVMAVLITHRVRMWHLAQESGQAQVA